MVFFRYAAVGLLIAFFLHPVKGQSHERHAVVLGKVKVTYHFMDNASRQKEAEFSQLIAQGFSAYTNLFGGLPRDLEGNVYNDIEVHVKKGRHMGGEADPRLIMLTWNEGKTFGFGSWQTLLLHELFHLWNAESFRYQDGREHWFNEGATEYYAYRTAVELGLLSPREMLAIAALPIGYYSAASGTGSLSMRAAGRTNKSKFDNYFLVYHGGWLVAMIIDYDIRAKTQGQKSLDDLLRWLYQEFPRNRALYQLEDITRGLKQVSATDYSDFFEQYVHGEKVIPVSDYFPVSDAQWAHEFHKHNRKHYRYLYQTLGFEIDG